MTSFFHENITIKILGQNSLSVTVWKLQTWHHCHDHLQNNCVK